MLIGSNQNGTAVEKADWVIRLSRISRLSADKKEPNLLCL